MLMSCKRLIIILSLVLVSVGAVSAQEQKQYYAPEDVPNVQLQNKNHYLSDPTKIIDAASAAHIDSTLQKLRTATGVQAAVVVLPNMDGDSDVDTYATDLFTLWGIGDKDKDNGLLLLVSVGDRKYVIRTGYGIEDALPDAICGRIERNIMVPAFEKGDYSGGIRAAVDNISSVLSDPTFRDEMLEDIAAQEREDWMSVLWLYIGFCVTATLITFVWLLVALCGVRGKTPYDKYQATRTLSRVSGACAWFTLGMTLLVYIPLRMIMRGWRNGAHYCSNCGTKMRKLDEKSDNEYLTPAQDAEERIKSVDYDVWLCPKCGTTEIYRFDEDSGYSECPYCHARTCRFVRDTVMQRPTQDQEGVGVKTYTCLNCKKTHSIAYKIAKLAPTVIVGGGGFGTGGDGISGGSWGGGSTGGGGASGGW